MGPDQTAYGRIIDDFARELTARLSQPLPIALTPPAPSPFFAPDQPPSFLIYVGAANPEQVKTLRNQLPPSAFLLFLHPPCLPEAEARFRQAMTAGRTLASGLDPESRFIEKTALLVASLPEKQVRLVVEQGFRETWAEPIRVLEESIRNILDNLQQDRNRGLIRLRCSLRNLPSICENSDTALAPVPQGVSAIVCGAGPSLRSQLELLKKNAHRAVIIATGHAVPELVRAGVVPHVVVEVDAHAGRNWPEDIRPDSLLAACTEVAPEVAERFKRVVWCAGSSPAFTLALHEWGLPLHEMQIARTVMVPAIDVAVRLGCSKIALVGQDLCLGENRLTHVDGETLEGDDEVVLLPGNDAPNVPSTRTFAALRDALQGYVKALQAGLGGTGPQLANCTAGGAAIEGLARTSLEAFCETLPPLPAALPLTVRRKTLPPPADALADVDNRMRQYGVLAESIVEVCLKLRKELEQQPLNVAKVRIQQKNLQQLIGREEEKRKEPNLRLWLQAVVQHVDRVMQETPGLISQENDPFKQLAYLEARYGFIRDLSEDLRRDFMGVVRRLRVLAAGQEEPSSSPFVFKSFREQALQRMGNSHRELAAFLRKTPAVLPPDRFQVRWMNQHVPFVKCRLSDGRWVALSGFTSMFDRAVLEVDAFVRQTAFDPARHAVVFAVPGNWVHVLEFARRYPQAQIMVLEPWIDLLSALIERGSFLHFLPPDALIVGVDDRLTEWKTLAHDRWLAWEQAGLTPCLFKHPALADSAEINQLLAAIAFSDKTMS
ncbi:MAG TPA: hypothetical protein DCZ95_06920 [Verrucomicrobia bacterium]|nr:MAG: hypothetical protein A2X46_06145 [Lentisphaerae bacterium GWF2_57_35]HBA83807.1 hypothetical protein [Verrucomicrobiota bacterium]